MTVSGFVAHDGRVALHWHRKIGMWLPAGGHIEPGEDPVEATLREVREEFAVEAEVMPLTSRVQYEGGPRQIEPPYTILDCWPEPDHCHVDHVYLLRLLSGFPGLSHDPDYPILWLTSADLALGYAHVDGRDVPFAPDVQSLALETLRQAARLAPQPAS